MKKTILLLTAILCFTNIAFTQSDKARTKKAEKAFDSKDYSSALAQYDILISKDDDDKKKQSSFDLYFKAAQSARLTKVYYRAEDYYKRAENCGINDLRAKYWLADVLKRQGKYNEARDSFNAFINSGGGAYADLASKANKQIADCDYAQTLVPKFEKEKLEHLKDSVNSDVSDFAPIKSGDILYFSSLRENYEMQRIADEKGSEWIQQVDDWRAKADADYGLTHIYTKKDNAKDVELFSEFNEGDKHTAHVALANNNQRIYYTLCERVNASDINCQLYYRDLVSEGKWGAKTTLPESVNTAGYTTTQPSVGFDKQAEKDVLFFSSNRPGSIGGLDIWCSFVNEDGTFSDPINLNESDSGNNINTAEDEITPFWDAANQTLYFSSEGHLNVGSHDIYKTEKNLGQWGLPENLGTPTNSSYDDMYYSISQDGDVEYLTSNRPGGKCSATKDSLCICNDIYKIDIPNVKLEVYTYNALDSSELDVTIVELDKFTTPEKDSQENGNFFKWSEAPLGFDFEYGVVGRKENYDDGRDGFSTIFEVKKDTLIRVDLYLMPKAELIVHVYDESTGEPLPGAKVDLYLIDSNQKGSIDKTFKDETKSDYFSSLSYERTYMVIGSKAEAGYTFPDTSFITIKGDPITTVDINTPIRLEAELFLCKEILQKPIPLYFDNAIPLGGSNDLSVNYSYKVNYDKYTTKRNIRNFVNKSDNKVLMQQFFDDEVIEGYNRLNTFCEDLYTELKKDKDNVATVVIKAFASRRAVNTKYSNKALTGRRASSLENFLNSWSKPGFDENGNSITMNLRDFINGDVKRIKITTEKFGDTLSCQEEGCEGIEDIKACRDRRVEIIRLEIERRCDDSSEEEDENPYQNPPPKNDNDY